MEGRGGEQMYATGNGQELKTIYRDHRSIDML